MIPKTVEPKNFKIRDQKHSCATRYRPALTRLFAFSLTLVYKLNFILKANLARDTAPINTIK